MNMKFILVILSLMVVIVLNTNYAGDMGDSWWNTEFPYRATVNITSVQDLNNYSVLIRLDNNSFDFSHANNDGSDIRVIDSDGSTQLQYWIGYWNKSSKKANIWVKIPHLSANSNKTIYIYSGNPSAHSLSNPNGMFLFFDDFNDGNWQDKWNKTGSGTISENNGYLEINSTGYEISLVSKGNNLPKEVRIESAVIPVDVSDTGIQLSLHKGYYAYKWRFWKKEAWYYSYNNINIYSQSGYMTGGRSNPPTTSSEYLIGGYKKIGDIGIYRPTTDFNDISILSNTYPGYSGDWSEVHISVLNPGIYKMDWILVRPYIPSEPTATVINTEYDCILNVFYLEDYNVSANVSGDGNTYYTIHNITGYLIINNSANYTEDTLSDVWIAINISNNISELRLIHDGTPKDIFIESSAPAYTGLDNSANTYIHIPMLPNNSYVKYEISLDKSLGSPILINETYDATKIPSNRLSNWTVNMTLTNNNTPSTISLDLTKYLSNDPNYHGNVNWTFLNISSYSENRGLVELWDGPYFSGDSNNALNWSGISLNSTNNGFLRFTVQGNFSGKNRNAILVNYGFATLKYNFKGTRSGTKINGVYAAGMGEISATKKGPYKNESSGEYNIWHEEASFNNTARTYAFNLTKMNLWAINGSDPTLVDPFNMALLINGSNYSFTPSTLINPGQYWSTNTYNFTFNDVPVVWANCTFTVANQNITTVSNGYNGKDNYIVIEKIYVVGSYLIKATKHVIPNADGTYDVYIVVENIGAEKSPYVYAYDLIPRNFNASNMWVNRSDMLAQHADNDSNNNYTGNKSLSAGDYSLSYLWALNYMNPGADGDGNYSDAAEIDNNQTVVIHYKLNGTGTFRTTDAFLVGIDPRHSLVPSTSPKTVLAGGAVSNNFEPLFALASSVIGTGFVLRRKTKGKDKK
ncbi:DUF2341 domain-containing protein [Methanothermococcus sp. Ax23]|uniref:DUF2341 domain-containing protein n=1 Tax=Methanothermococcus sp. Ax23 TaxID=3156486 RepID=UPI003BA0A765